MSSLSRLSQVARHVQRRTRNYTPRQTVAWGLAWLYWNTPIHRLNLHRAANRWRQRESAQPTLNGASVPICESVWKWAEGRKDVTFQLIEPERRLKVQLPPLSDPVMRREIVWASQQPLPEQYLAMIQGAQVLGARGLVRLPDGSYALEVSYGDTKILQGAVDGLKLDTIPAQPKSGSFYSISLPYFPNYAHWLMDVLVRVMLAQEHLPPDVTYIAPKALLPFQSTSLEVLGISRARCVEIGWREVWQVERLYMTPMSSYFGIDRPEANRRLRQLFWNTCNIQAPRAHRRLLISRRGGNSRRIVNEQQLERELAPFGFDTVVPETLTLLDQVKLFSEAEFVIGAHGAGLTNLVFAPDGAWLFDILEPSYVQPFFWTLCLAFNHEYRYMLAETVPNAGGSIGKDSDIYVPLDKFKAQVVPILERLGAK